MNPTILQQINVRPLQTVDNLIRAFGKSPSRSFSNVERSIPIGIEIEVPWRGYFPDLWVEGFPNIPDDQMEDITNECTRREQDLIPNLMKAQRCGVPSGADKYWEFAFEPVTDISILCNQVQILRENNLIPEGQFALHITVGGVRPTRSMYVIAMILEAYACSVQRLRSGYATTGPYQLSTGWAKKGSAGLFMKEGCGDLLHGYNVGTEFRILHTPATTNELFFLLDTCQKLVEINETLNTTCDRADGLAWYRLNMDLKNVLDTVDLPDTNWGRPRDNPELWDHISLKFPELQRATRATFERSPLYCPPPK